MQTVNNKRFVSLEATPAHVTPGNMFKIPAAADFYKEMEAAPTFIKKFIQSKAGQGASYALPQRRSGSIHPNSTGKVLPQYSNSNNCNFISVHFLNPLCIALSDYISK